MPSFVTDKTTLIAKALFHHPDTELNTQGLQSVICVPAHDEVIHVPQDGENVRFSNAVVNQSLT